jgi:hypothetical protein
MKLYRLYNLTELGPASGLHFFKREGAEAYKDLVKWPYADSGRWPLSNGSTVPLSLVDLRVEEAEMDVLLAPEQEAVIWEQEKALGSAPLLPGDCFDPDEWRAYSSADLANPVTGIRVEQAWRRHKQGA